MLPKRLPTSARKDVGRSHRQISMRLWQRLRIKEFKIRLDSKLVSSWLNWQVRQFVREVVYLNPVTLKITEVRILTKQGSLRFGMVTYFSKSFSVIVLGKTKKKKVTLFFSIVNHVTHDKNMICINKSWWRRKSWPSVYSASPFIRVK